MHLEILDKQRQLVLGQLQDVNKEFILGGGTALVLQIKHRKSFDFDFFSKKEIPRALLTQIKKHLKVQTVAVDNADELTFFTKDNIKLTFLYYPFLNIFQSEYIKKEKDFSLFSLKAIASQKAYTIGRRGEYRDYFDIYFLLKEKYLSLAEIIKLTEQIYESVFNPKLFLEQLTYFGDLLNFEIIPISSEVELPDKEDIKNFLEEKVKEYLQIIPQYMLRK